MEIQQNLNNMLEELSSEIFILQSEMIKVMNGINKINLIIKKIQQHQLNNMNNNIMMNNMNNNIMMNNMNNNIMMNNIPNLNIGMNNINFEFQNQNFKKVEEWNLLFENKTLGGNVNIIIDPQQYIKEAINRYCLRSEIDPNNYKFMFNGRDLIPDMKIIQSGLSDNSRILAIQKKILL